MYLVFLHAIVPICLGVLQVGLYLNTNEWYMFELERSFKFMNMFIFIQLLIEQYALFELKSNDKQMSYLQTQMTFVHKQFNSIIIPQF